MAIIAAGMFSTYSLFNPLFIDWASVRGVAFGHFSFIPLLILYAWYVGRPGYPANRLADAALFFAAQPGVFMAAQVFAATGVSDWTFETLLTYNLMVALAFACLTFSAAVEQFFVLTIVSIVYLATVLLLRDQTAAQVFYTGVFYGAYAILIAYINWAIDDKARLLFESRQKLDAEKKKTEVLLHNVLPQSVARRLQSGEAIADAFDDVSILFVDVVGFTKLSKTMPATELVKLLNAYFSKADAGCDLFGIEKVKTIGDAFMAVSGAIVPTPRPAKAMVDFARYLIDAARDLSAEFGLDFKLRVGINTGPVVGGVISSKRMHYDYWGDAINVAQRMETAAAHNGIAVSRSTWEATRDTYAYNPPRVVLLKNLGEVPVYDLVMETPSAQPLASVSARR